MPGGGSNNGARIALDGQSMSGQDSNDDSTFGLGMLRVTIELNFEY